jgi:hypothetical protein
MERRLRSRSASEVMRESDVPQHMGHHNGSIADVRYHKVNKAFLLVDEKHKKPCCDERCP